jgi:PIN domain nuclease of toxin-antitoxin system
MILDAIENEKFLSMASIWEMALKKNSGKLTLAKPLQSYIPPEIDIKLVHIFHLESLPEYHKDPFDRIIIATSMVEQMPIISIDEVFEQYDVLKIWNN